MSLSPEHQAAREKQLAASKPYTPGRFVPGSFCVIQRDMHHFDITAQRRPGYVQWYYEHQNPHGVAFPMNDDSRERAFAVRGEPGNIYVRDERWDYTRPHPREMLHFPTVEAAMAWITATLLIE